MEICGIVYVCYSMLPFFMKLSVSKEEGKMQLNEGIKKAQGQDLKHFSLRVSQYKQPGSYLLAIIIVTLVLSLRTSMLATLLPVSTRKDATKWNKVTLKRFPTAILKAVFDKEGNLMYVILADKNVPLEKTYSVMGHKVTLNQVKPFYTSYYPITSYGDLKPKKIVFFKDSREVNAIELPDSDLVKIWSSEKGHYLGIEIIKESAEVYSYQNLKGNFMFLDLHGNILWEKDWSQILQESLFDGVPEDFVSISDSGATAVAAGKKLYIFDKNGNSQTYPFRCRLRSIIKWSSEGSLLGVPACDSFYLFNGKGQSIRVFKEEPDAFWLSPQGNYLLLVRHIWESGNNVKQKEKRRNLVHGRNLKVKLMLFDRNGRKMWELEKNQAEFHSLGNQFLYDVIFNPSEKFILTTSRNCKYFFVLDLQTGKIIQKLLKPSSFVGCDITYVTFTDSKSRSKLFIASGNKILHCDISTKSAREFHIPCDYVLWISSEGRMKGITSDRIFFFNIKE